MTNQPNFSGKYQIIEEIASGAFGRVYRGIDTSAYNRIVAIKLMHSSNLDSLQERTSFLQEAQFLKMLQHPYILPILDVGIDDNFPYIVTEYAPNGSLYQRMKQMGSRLLPLDQIMQILLQVGQALQYAHQQNVIHRDLKPANILFNAHGDALLADFGIATMLASSMKFGTAIGTPYYMAPEQFRGTISKEGDQYALGCIAYELLTGRMPFNAADFFALGYKHMSETPVPPTQLNLLMPRSCEQAILKALSKQRTDRFPSIAAFLDALMSKGTPGMSPFIPNPVPQAAPQNVGRYEIAVDDELVDKTIARPLYSDVMPSSNPPGYRQNYTSTRSPFVEIEGQVSVPEQWNPLATSNPLASSNPLARNMYSPFPEVEGQVAAPERVNPFLTTSNPLARNTPSPFVEIEGQVSVPEQRNQPPSTRRLNETTRHLPPEHGGYTTELLPENRGEPPHFPGTPHPFVGSIDIEQQDYSTEWATASLKDDASPHSALTFANNSGDWVAGPVAAKQAKKKSRKRSIWLIAASIALLFILIGGGALYAFTNGFHKPVSVSLPSLPGSHSNLGTSALTASVTITPARMNFNQTYKIFAVTGTPNASSNQVDARYLSSTTPWQSSTIAATGKSNTAGVRATGQITFNSNINVSHTFNAGQTFGTGNGLTAVLSEGFTINAFGGPVSYNAYISTAGTNGNIPAMSINTTCCPDNTGNTISIYNLNPFSGGVNPQSYTYLQQSDLNNAAAAANQIEAAETASARSIITGQVRSNEALFGSIACTPHATYNHRTGDHATSVTASASVTCSAEVYDQQAALTMGGNLLKNSINSSPNNAYSSGAINTTITQVSAAGAGTIQLLVQAQTTGLYQFSASQKTRLISLIAGKTTQQAQAILLNQPGIAKATITLSGGGDTLPTDVKQITLLA